MNKEIPLVSVIIATYNSEKYIETAIESALMQTYPNIEVIVVDDGSTDNTSKILQKYDDITIIKQENKGVAGARNTGINNSHGEYIAILDSDDKWLKNRLSIMIPDLIKSGCELCISNYYYVNEKRQRISDEPAYSNEFKEPLENQYKALLWKAVSFSMMIVKADAIKSIGGYDESLRGEAEDYDLWLRLLRNGAKWKYINEPLAEYMVRSGSLSKGYSNKRKAALKRIFNKHVTTIGSFRAFVLYRYHLGGYRWDMLVIAIKEKNIIKAMIHCFIMFRSIFFIPVIVFRIINYLYYKKLKLVGVNIRDR